MDWLTELLFELLFQESKDNGSEGGEQELLCSSTRVASLWSDAVAAEEWRSYCVVQITLKMHDTFLPLLRQTSHIPFFRLECLEKGEEPDVEPEERRGD